MLISVSTASSTWRTGADRSVTHAPRQACPLSNQQPDLAMAHWSWGHAHTRDPVRSHIKQPTTLLVCDCPHPGLEGEESWASG